MPTFPMMQVDAFTVKPLAGNPCAVIFDADDLDETQMLAIAREMNLSETAFVLRSEKADVRARYFTPVEEIPLAGHPTIATVHALIESGRLTPSRSHSVIKLELQVGVIDVEIIDEKLNGLRRIIMSQKAPQFLRTYDPNEVMPAFGLAKDDMMPGRALQTVSTGTPQLMIPVHSPEVLQRADLDVGRYKALRSRGDFFSAHLFCMQRNGDEIRTAARHFNSPPDLIEDPFTGSATGGMGAYLWYYGLIESPKFTAEQGSWINRPGTATVEVVGDRDDIQTVKVGGLAVTVLRGELLL
jgi:trans-2,3-dihydro-3-hydroxyanthranilate isomerase